MVARLSREEQIKRMIEIHQGFYTYENWGWPTSHEKSSVMCPIHGLFETTYRRHVNKRAGCPTCGSEKRSEANRRRWSEGPLREIHQQKWQDPEFRIKQAEAASKSLKKRWQDPEFQELMAKANSRFGPSQGVCYLADFLKENGIEYQGGEDQSNEFRIPDTGYRFDFYLPDYNLFIEFHGKQHYEGWGGKEENLAKKQHNDQWKANWARDEGYDLLVIPYWDTDDIPVILSEALGL